MIAAAVVKRMKGNKTKRGRQNDLTAAIVLQVKDLNTHTHTHNFFNLFMDEHGQPLLHFIYIYM